MVKTNAQTIPNPNFELWTNGSPNGWMGTGISQSSDFQTGASSVKFTLDTTFGMSFLILNVGNMLATGTVSTYLNGYIKANLSVSDSFVAEVAYKRNSDQAEAAGVDVTSISRSAWTPFHVTVIKPSGFTTDSFGIAFVFNAISSSSWVLIDNISLSNTAIGNELGASLYSGIKNISKQNINSSIYPNPTNGNAEIDFLLTSSSNINIKIYDVTGRCVKTILNEKKSEGGQKITLNATELRNGIYFYTITGDGFSETKKFVINK